MISEDDIHGTVNYISDYTGYSDFPAQQQGYYLALHVAENGYGTVAVGRSGDLAPKLLDEDRVVIIRSNTNSDLVYDIVVSAWESADADPNTDPPSVTKTYHVSLYGGDN